MAAYTSSIVNSATSLSPSNPLQQLQRFPLPLTSFARLSPPPTTTTLSQSLKTTQKTQFMVPKDSHSSLHSDLVSVLSPSLPYSNILFFKSMESSGNVEIVVDEDEPEGQLINRFRNEVYRAGIIQEAKRRRFHETTQEKRKRKAREAAIRNRKWRQPLRVVEEDNEQEAPKKKDNVEEDNWEFDDTQLPY